MSRITITINAQSLVGNTHQPLLQQLEQAGLQPEFQCRNGICGACRCKLKLGAVSQENALAYLAKGEILTCRAIPQQNVTLKFNYPLFNSTFSV